MFRKLLLVPAVVLTLVFCSCRIRGPADGGNGVINSTQEQISMRNVRDFGAVGDGRTKDTAAIQKAIDAGGVVCFPPGTYLSGTLYLRSGGGLHLEPGATLLASPDKADYNADDFCPQNAVFSKENVSGAHFIVALEQHDVSITGGGTIDGNRQAFYGKINEDYPRKFKLGEWRPGQMIYFCECTNVRISDVALNHAPYWTCFLHGCEQVTVRGVRIWNDYHTPNGDGIDIDCCRFVTVSDCIIHSGDDCITLRGSDKRLKQPRPCEYVTVTNCILGTNCNAFRIGVGNGVIRNCTISNIIMENTRTGIQINSRYSRNSEGVTIENILFSDFQMDVKRPIAVCSDVRGPHDEDIKPIRNLVFRNLNGSACWSNLIESNRRGDIRGITFSGLHFRYYGGEDVQEGDGLLYGEFAARNAPAAFHAANVEKLIFSDVRIDWDTDSPNWKYGILTERCSEVELFRCDFGRKNSINGKITE